MKWSAYNKGNFFTHVKRVIVILANKARILAREIAKQLGSLLQRQRIISDRRIKTTGSDRSSIGFRQLSEKLRKQSNMMWSLIRELLWKAPSRCPRKLLLIGVT